MSTTARQDPVLPAAARPSPWLAARTLCVRELIRFFRQRNRVIGALGQPILFWLLFGVGLNRSFALSPAGQDGESFLRYFFPGTIVLILLFTAIFATISIIEDRREGFLQSVLVAPIPRWSMVLGKILGGTLIAFVQAMVFLMLAVTLKVDLGWSRIVMLAVWLFLSAVGLTSLGFVIAWRMESTQGFHAIMNLLLMPMWLLSGAFWPIPAWVEGAGWAETILHWMMRINPVTYCVAGVRQLVYNAPLPAGFYTPDIVTCWLVTLAFAVVTFAAACRISAQRITGDLQ